MSITNLFEPPPDMGVDEPTVECLAEANCLNERYFHLQCVGLDEDEEVFILFMMHLYSIRKYCPEIVNRVFF